MLPKARERFNHCLDMLSWDVDKHTTSSRTASFFAAGSDEVGRYRHPHVEQDCVLPVAALHVATDAVGA
eukprot:5820252-Pyramimonas_sp.AAC.1